MNKDRSIHMEMIEECLGIYCVSKQESARIDDQQIFNDMMDYGRVCRLDDLRGSSCIGIVSNFVKLISVIFQTLGFEDHEMEFYDFGKISGNDYEMRIQGIWYASGTSVYELMINTIGYLLKTYKETTIRWYRTRGLDAEVVRFERLIWNIHEEFKVTREWTMWDWVSPDPIKKDDRGVPIIFTLN